MNNQLIDPCQPTNEWIDAHTRKKCSDYVLKMQRQLDKAVRDNDMDRIRHLSYLLSRRSKAVRIVAIDRVTKTYGGKYAAGVDGVKTPKQKAEADKFRKHLYDTIKIDKTPSPSKRIYIPKPNGKKRPLGIATISDRVIQAIIRMAIEPIAEYHFSDNSYGFRPKRSCHDAIGHLFLKASRKCHPQWIIEGDIKGCFDAISHHAILNKMSQWHIPKAIRVKVARMLRAGILSEDRFETNECGTPQGSILSPMLANMALTVLDEWGESQETTNPILRYADDVVVCKTKAEAQQRKEEIKSILKEKLGLQLSEEKTSITNIHDGIDFLGFTVRKYRHQSPYSKYHTVGQLLITPQKDKVQRFLSECGQLIRKAKGQNLAHLIVQLNPKLQGFTNYYRFVASSRTFVAMSSGKKSIDGW